MVLLQPIIGQYVFNSIDDFMKSQIAIIQSLKRRYTLTYSICLERPFHLPLPSHSTGYLPQDEVTLLKDRMKITYGIRADLPSFLAMLLLHNSEVDGFTFKDASGNPLKLSTFKIT